MISIPQFDFLRDVAPEQIGGRLREEIRKTALRYINAVRVEDIDEQFERLLYLCDTHLSWRRLRAMVGPRFDPRLLRSTDDQRAQPSPVEPEQRSAGQCAGRPYDPTMKSATSAAVVPERDDSDPVEHVLRHEHARALKTFLINAADPIQAIRASRSTELLNARRQLDLYLWAKAENGGHGLLVGGGAATAERR